MTDDPTRPISSGWQQGPGTGRPDPRWQGSDRQGSDRQSPGGQGFDRPGYDSQSANWQGSGSVRRRRRRWPVITGIIVLVLAAILVIADRASVAYAQNRMASQIKTDGFPVKPGVTIEGFPFLTQVASHDLNTVKISASNVTEGSVVITSINATMSGLHINSSWNGGTVDQLNGTALISFGALANAGGIGSGVTLSDGGNNQVKANVDVLGITDTATAQITRSGPKQINVHVTDAGGIPTSLLGSLANFNIDVPQLPAGMTIQSVNVTPSGVVITITGHNTTLSQ
jgi:hypothetical protein